MVENVAQLVINRGKSGTESLRKGDLLRWNGTVPIKVNPRGTSSKCAACGETMITEERRMVRCPVGNITVDRDKHACINILARGTKVVPVGSANEAMEMDSHERISLMVKNSVDADQLASNKIPTVNSRRQILIS